MLRRFLIAVTLTSIGIFASAQGQPTLIDDFESGSLKGWTVENRGVGSWYVYSNGKTPPNPSHTDPNVPFDVPGPPQGKFAAVTDMDGPGARFLSRTLMLDGRYRLRLTLFYVNSSPEGFLSPNTLGVDDNNVPNQQFRIDLMTTASPIDSLAPGDIKANIFHTSPGDPAIRAVAPVTFDLSPWAGQTVRLRFAGADNIGPLRVGVDDIKLEPLQ